LVRDIENFKITQKAPERTTGKEKVRASSLARRLAERKGVSLEAIQGTGIRNRIMMKDVIHATPKSAIAPEGKELFGQTIPMNRMRKVIAKRISQSAFTAPHVYFFTDVDHRKKPPSLSTTRRSQPKKLSFLSRKSCSDMKKREIVHRSPQQRK
jgi:pyruvate dehydrogenase E2 component (dihydrolipoamide acetyltransferase)